MRQRVAAAAAVAAAASGDAVTRRRRVVCDDDWFGSPSVSASGAPTTSEACHRTQASVYLFIIVFLPGSPLLIMICFYDTGTTKRRGWIKGYAMEHSPWKYAERKLELKMLHEDRPREVVDMRDYCLQMPVIDRFIVPGAIEQRQKDGTMAPLEKKALLAEPAQQLSRAALVFLDGLFRAGYCLRAIKDDTLKVDTSTVTVMLSKEASEEDFIPITCPEDQDNTIALMGNKLKEYTFTQNGLTTIDVPEVEAFYTLMAEPASSKMWYAILNNAALVPLENLREYYVRTYEQLDYVARRENHHEFNEILEELIFPLDWHDKISRDLNGVLFILYGGSIYNATAVTTREQADQITTMFRNSGVHVLDKMGFHIGRSDVCIIHLSLAPLLYSSLAKALQKRGWLASSNVHTLFVYTCRRG